MCADKVQAYIGDYLKDASIMIGRFMPTWQVVVSSASDGIKTAIATVGTYLSKRPIDDGVIGRGCLRRNNQKGILKFLIFHPPTPVSSNHQKKRFLKTHPETENT